MRKKKMSKGFFFLVVFTVLVAFFSSKAYAYTFSFIRVHPAIVGDIVDVACDTDNNTCVAVGQYGYHSKQGEIIYRDSSGNWTPVSKNIQYPPLKDVEYGGGKFLAISSNKVYMSSDGKNWNKVYDNSSLSFGVLGPAMNLAYGNNRFVAINYNGCLSCDLSGSCSYHQIVNYPPYNFTGIAFGSNKFVIYGEKFTNTDYPYVWTSSDGINFDNTSLVSGLGTGKQIYSMVYGGGTFLASVEHGESPVYYDIYSSSNGTSWNSTGESNLKNCVFTGFCNNKIFAIMQQENSDYTDAYYYDGNNWNDIDSSFELRPEMVTSYGNGCVAVSYDGYIAESSDGISWKSASEIAKNVYRVRYIDNMFYGTGLDGTIFTSSDGSSWQKTTVDGLDGYEVRDIASNGEVLIAVGYHFRSENGLIMSNSDGNWSIDNSSLPYALYGITYGDGRFVAVGNGKIISSTDGSNWIEDNISDNISGITLRSVIYADNKYVAVGYNGTILSSSDGLDWSKDNTTTDQNLFDVAYGNGKFVAIGGRIVLKSDDGINWSEASQPAQGNCFGVTFDSYDGEFVALDWHGFIYTSKYGDKWTQNTSIDMPYSSGSFNDIAFGNNKLVVSGDYGWIFLSSLSDIMLDYFLANDESGNLKGTPPFTVDFTCSATGGSGGYKYYWDFNGDIIPDNVTTDCSITHTYTEYGEYPASVKVVDSSGYDNESGSIFIKVAPSNGDANEFNIKLEYPGDNTTAYPVQCITDNASITDVHSYISSTNCDNHQECESIKNEIQDIKNKLQNKKMSFAYEIKMKLSLNNGANSARVTLKNLRLVPDVDKKDIFYKYVNGKLIDLADNTTCSDCNFTRTDNLTAHTTTISFTITDGGPLDADNVSGTITDPIVLATKSASSSGGSSGGTTTQTSSSGGGGGCTVSNSSSIGLLFILFAMLGFAVKRKFIGIKKAKRIRLKD